MGCALRNSTKTILCAKNRPHAYRRGSKIIQGVHRYADSTIHADKKGFSYTHKNHSPFGTRLCHCTYYQNDRSKTCENAKSKPLPAARGAAAEVPVCFMVHLWCKSVVTISLLMPLTPLLYVTAIVPGHGSAYHGDLPQSSTAPIDIVYMLFIYPSQLQ